MQLYHGVLQLSSCTRAHVLCSSSSANARAVTHPTVPEIPLENGEVIDPRQSAQWAEIEVPSSHNQSVAYERSFIESGATLDTPAGLVLEVATGFSSPSMATPEHGYVEVMHLQGGQANGDIVLARATLHPYERAGT